VTFPNSYEDHLLQRYWEAQGKRGLMVVEVQLGRDGPVGVGGSKRKGHWRMDAVYIPDHPRGEIREWHSGDELDNEIVDRDVEIIEAKRFWNTDVIGQVVAGAALVGHSFPRHRLVTKVVLVDGEPDSTLESVCDNLGIRWHRIVAYPKVSS
jgi:hypothetical protein